MLIKRDYKNSFLEIMKVCKMCGSIREFYMSHTCSDNKYVTGRNHRMTNINTNYQYVELINNEYVVKNKPNTDNKFGMIEIEVYRTSLRNISEFFKEIFELCSKFKIEHSVKYSEDFNSFDFKELQGWDSSNISAFIRNLLIIIYNDNEHED